MRITTTRPPMLFFFFNDTATTEIYTLSLHDALPISHRNALESRGLTSYKKSPSCGVSAIEMRAPKEIPMAATRSEEHTSELQSRSDLVCRLLLEKENMNTLGLHVRAPRYRLCIRESS